ncbi:hypothetical protein ACFXGT_05530 [Streptomyces sp. NPDC059352]|uniref:hypothetical protein n=1 Tax=Streptomyces sp. NPDC059352 TaxID=3346810 RepID=UPI00369082E3
MTLVQMQPRSANATPARRSAADAVDTDAPRVCDDMTVEVALSVMTSARAGHLLICDDDGLCTHLVTRAQLAAVRDGAAYTDRIRLRDVLVVDGRGSAPDVLVVDGRGSAPGVLALAR